MNKKIALIAVATCFAAGLAYAGAPAVSSDAGNATDGSWFSAAPSGKITFPSGTTNGPLIQFTPSANVNMAYQAGGGTAYKIGAYHESGVKAYSGSSVDSKMYMYDLGSPKGTTDPGVTIPDTSTNYGSGWSAMQ